MPVRLGHNSYGKCDIRLTKVVRRANRHDLTELSVDVELRGDFAETYLKGDNRNVVATDSMKNTVYALAKDHPLDNIESFAIALVNHFVKTYGQVESANATVRQTSWERIRLKARPHPHAFVSRGGELRVCRASRAGRTIVISGGLSNLLVLKTTNSAFKGFVRDRYTTLHDTDDRILATDVRAWWTYRTAKADFNRAFASVRAAMLETFARHQSLSVQQTLYAMGEAALRQCRDVREIGIVMPNRHRIPVDLRPLGLENDNDLFVWTDHPFGEISAHLNRS
jgi:urate oxidase